MDVEQLMKLIDKVSESDLTGFKYEENGIKLQLNKKENLVMGTTAAVQAVTPEAVKVTGASSKAATDLEEGSCRKCSQSSACGNILRGSGRGCRAIYSGWRFREKRSVGCNY